MTTFSTFQIVAPIPESTIEQYGAQVPAEVVDTWRQYGTGFVGDGYFRLVDPARVCIMLGTVNPFPRGWVVLFTTAMADLIATNPGVFAVAKLRLGETTLTVQP
jgi:hypothetical protein